MNAALRSLPISLALCAAASAQISTLVLPAGIGDDPRSVQLVANNSFLAISNQVDGWLHMVNVVNPLSPTLVTSYNPPFGDQWFEAEYTPDNGGRLFTAHRGGGLNMIDVSVPSAPFAVASAATTYHFRGLRYKRGAGTGTLYYNETNQGLGAFAVTGGGTALTMAWNNYTSGTNDGNGLELMGNELYQFLTPPGAPTTKELHGFNVTAPLAPVQNLTAFFSSQTGGHNLLRRQPGQPYLMASRWNDGLDLFDVTVPTAPVQYTIIPQNPMITCWGHAFVPNSPFCIAYGSVLVGTTHVYFWLLLQVMPGPVVVPLNVFVHNFDTHDIYCEPAGGRIYVVGRDMTTMQGKLMIF